MWETGSKIMIYLYGKPDKKTIDQVYVKNRIENHIARGPIHIADARTHKTKYSSS